MNVFDQTIMAFVQDNLHNPVTDAVFPVITYLGENGILWILLSLLLLFLKKYRRFGFTALVALLLTLVVGEIFIKNIVCRPRPFMDFPEATLLIPPPNGFSFPSGHSASSFAAATVMLFANKKLGISALVLAALIAFSRVFLFVHYPTDMLAGAALGIACALLAVYGLRLIKKQWDLRHNN